MPQIRREDSITGKLGYLLNQHESVRQSFLRFVKAPSSWIRNAKEVTVKTQVVIPNGRIDLLLQHGSHAIIIECKVDDIQKRYQLEKYYDYWQKLHGVAPLMIWLTRRHDPSIIGQDKYLHCRLGWDELCRHLKDNMLSYSLSAYDAVDEFINVLKSHGALLTPNETSFVTKRSKGMPRERATHILESVASHFPDCKYDVDEENSLPYRLLIGRRIWISEFDDDFPLKVRILLEPDVNHPSGNFVWPRVCLFHWQQYLSRLPTKPARRDHFSGRIRQCVSVCLNAGLIPMRNAPRRHERVYNIKMLPPYQVDSSLKVLLAEEPIEMAKSESAYQDVDSAIIKNIIRRTEKYLSIVNKFSR